VAAITAQRPLALPSQDAGHYCKAETGDERDCRKRTQCKYNDLVLRFPIHFELHLFGAKRPNGLISFMGSGCGVSYMKRRNNCTAAVLTHAVGGP
jgi:hypothetical protein